MSRVQPALKNAAESEVSDALFGRLGTVLLVEDEDFVREVTAEILEAQGYVVLKARTAKEARTTFRQHDKFVGLLLTDIVLPDENGCELAQGLRILSARLPVIFMSGYAKTIASKVLKDACTFYLPKPYTAESLLQKVGQVFAAGETNSMHACDSLQPV